MYKKRILSWQQALLNATTGGKKATLTECYNEVVSMYGVEKNAVRSWFRRYRKNHPEHKVVLSSKAITNEPNEKEKKQKPVIFQNFAPIRMSIGNNSPKHLTIGVLSDTHYGSKYVQQSHLTEFYRICSEHGVSSVYHAGDVTDGIKMRPGHEYELYTSSSDELVESVCKNYPKIEGINTYFISGNHDASIFKAVGHDICKDISDKRDDMIYLGRDCAVIDLCDSVDLELRHPWDGGSYALSYRPQKMVEAMEADSKPKILVIGHYHKSFYMFYRNVHVFCPGCFQAQTPWERGKSIAVHMGGWILGLDISEKGIDRIYPEFIPFYAPIKDDYKNLR